MLIDTHQKRPIGIRWFYQSTPRGAGIYDSTGLQHAHWPEEFAPTKDRIDVAIRLIASMPRWGIPIQERTLRTIFSARERAAA